MRKVLGNPYPSKEGFRNGPKGAEAAKCLLSAVVMFDT